MSTRWLSPGSSSCSGAAHGDRRRRGLAASAVRRLAGASLPGYYRLARSAKPNRDSGGRHRPVSAGTGQRRRCWSPSLGACIRPVGRMRLLARFGAVSRLRGVRYWSVTDQAWKTLIHDAFAVTDAAGTTRRDDFRPNELQPGVSLYSAERDGRSSGMVIYRMRVIERTPDADCGQCRQRQPRAQRSGHPFCPRGVADHLFSRPARAGRLGLLRTRGHHHRLAHRRPCGVRDQPGGCALSPFRRHPTRPGTAGGTVESARFAWNGPRSSARTPTRHAHRDRRPEPSFLLISSCHHRTTW